MIILGLGTNVGDRLEFLAAAIKELSTLLNDVRLSPVYESDAILPADAPAEWNMPYLNIALAGHTSLSPEDLLKETQTIETKLGRKPHEHWSPREIDIDIVCYDDVVMDEEHLTIPHHFLLKRPFALWPMADLAPDWRYPVPGKYHGKTAFALAQTFGVPYPADGADTTATGTWLTDHQIIQPDNT